MPRWSPRSRWPAGRCPPRAWSSARWPRPAATWASCPAPARPASSGPRNAPWTFSPPETGLTLKGAGENGAEPVEVDVPAGDDADDLAPSRAPGEGARQRAGPRALGDHAAALRQHADRGRHLGQARLEGAVDQAPGPLQHLGEDGLGADAVHEGGAVVDHPRRSCREGLPEGSRGLHLGREESAVRPAGLAGGGDPAEGAPPP